MENKISKNNNFNINELISVIFSGIREIKRINRAIWRYYNSRMTKKQRKSAQFSNNYWKNVRYLDCKNSIEENTIIYKILNLKYDRYEKNLKFSLIKDAYTARDIILSKNITEIELYECYINDINTFLLKHIKNSFQLSLNGFKLEVKTIFNKLPTIKNVSQLILNNCILISLENVICNIKYLVSYFPNIKKLTINNLNTCYSRAGGSTHYTIEKPNISYPKNIKIKNIDVITDGKYSTLDIDSGLWND